MLKKNIFHALLMVFLLCSQQLFAKPDKVLPLEHFAKHREARDVQISPDGRYLSVVLKDKGEDVLAILDSRNKEPVNAFHVKGERLSVGHVHWVSDERLVYTINESYKWDKGIRNNFELVGVNVDGSKHKLLFGYRTGRKSVGSLLKGKEADFGRFEILDLLPEDEKNILLTFYPWKVKGNYLKPNHNALPIVYKLNINSGTKKKVTSLPVPYAQGLTDNKGEVRFSIGVNKDARQVVFYRQDKDWKTFELNGFAGKKAKPIAFSEDNNSVYLLANVGDGTKALFSADLKTKSTKKLFHDSRVDISNVLYNFSREKIIGVRTDLGLPEYHYLDKTDRSVKLHNSLRTTFSGADVRFSSETSDGKSVIVYVSSDVLSGDYYLFDTEKVKINWLFSERSWLDANYLVKKQAIELKARDGQILHGYLTQPQSKDSIAPLVVMPHGGPHTVRDFWRFEREVQMLANNGYAVLQVNFRGSGGFGEKFSTAGYGQWGGLMQDDLTDATQELVKRGLAQKGKICIYGASYGAYAAMMGVIREPDLYQCAVGSMGVYDLPMIYEEGDIQDRQSGLAYVKSILGEDENKLKQLSPVYNAEKIKANIMLVHGAQDMVAPISQANAMRKALDDAGKKYQWLKISNEGHGFVDEKNRVRVYKKVLKFLDKNIGA